MTITDTKYRIKIDVNYTTTTTANAAETAINNVLIAAGLPDRVIKSTLNIYLMIVGLDQAAAVSLRDSLNSAWSTPARSGGKVSCVRSNDLD